MKQILNHHFWTSQNLGLLVASLIPVPIMLGITTYIIRDSNNAEATTQEEETAEVAEVTPPVPVVEPVEPEPQADPVKVEAFLSRIGEVHQDSNLYGKMEALRNELAGAKAVELVDTTYFESGHRQLSSLNETALETQFQTSDAISRFSADPNAIIVVLGYADQVGAESVNNSYALARAQSVEDKVAGMHSHPTYSWFVGETDRFGAEASFNRIAETWLIVPQYDLFAGIGSDQIVSTPAPAYVSTKSTPKATPYYPPATNNHKKNKCSTVSYSKKNEDKPYITSDQFRRMQMLRRRSCN